MGERDIRRMRELYTRCEKCHGHFPGNHCPICSKKECKDCGGDLRSPDHSSGCPSVLFPGLKKSNQLINAMLKIPHKRIVITDKDGNPYLERIILKESEQGKTYLHIIYKSDDDRDMHTHPWDFQSQILYGSYINHMSGSSKAYYPGDTNCMLATDGHRLEVVDGPVVTLVTRGPKISEWGFITSNGFVHHETYLDEKFGPGNWTKGDSDE